MKVYCANCKTKKEIKDTEEVLVTRRYRIIKGKCTGCAKEIHKILEKKNK